MYPKRAAALFIALILMLSAVTVRLFYLSMGALPGLDTQAGYAQYSRTRTAAVRRGLIYDRNFQPLAGIHSGWLAVIDHAAFDYDAQGEALCRAAGIPLGKLKQYRREGVPFVLPVEENISSSTIYCLPTFVRRTDSIAAHVIGYLNSSGQGVCGLEAAYDSLLNAYGGRFSLTYQVNAIDVQMGNSTLILTDSNYYSAGGVVTTLDRSLQQGIESIGPEKGAIVIADIASGHILASASFPAFDVNNVAASLDSDGGNLTNRASLCHTPGSLFKIITAAAALESGRISPAFTVECTGEGCYGGHPHGIVDMSAAMAQSCNAYFQVLTARIGGDSVREMAARFGIGQGGSIDGIYRGKGQIDAHSTANLAIGQGGTLISPYEMLAVISAVANGGTAVPLSLVWGFCDDDGAFTPWEVEEKRVISARTAALLCEMLRGVISEGTGHAALPAGHPDGDVGGKTATAQSGQRSPDGSELLHTWFAGFCENYAIVVFCEGTGGAAEIFSKCADLVLDQLRKPVPSI